MESTTIAGLFSWFRSRSLETIGSSCSADLGVVASSSSQGFFWCCLCWSLSCCDRWWFDLHWRCRQGGTCTGCAVESSFSCFGLASRIFVEEPGCRTWSLDLPIHLLYHYCHYCCNCSFGSKKVSVDHFSGWSTWLTVMYRWVQYCMAILLL